MDLPYFYIQDSPSKGSLIALKEDTSRHCIQVLRMRKDEPLMLTNGMGGLYHASIFKEDKKDCLVRIHEVEQINPVSRKITIAISLLKNASRFEWFLEKTTELGISHIIPLICHRTEKQYFRQDRMNNIVVSAMLQSKQTYLPVLSEPSSFQQFVETNTCKQNFIAHCIEDNKQALADNILQPELCILIGPEGDFSAEEINTVTERNYIPITLGNTRLRTETAGIVAATLAVNQQ